MDPLFTLLKTAGGVERSTECERMELEDDERGDRKSNQLDVICTSKKRETCLHHCHTAYKSIIHILIGRVTNWCSFYGNIKILVTNGWITGSN